VDVVVLLPLFPAEHTSFTPLHLAPSPSRIADPNVPRSWAVLDTRSLTLPLTVLCRKLSTVLRAAYTAAGPCSEARWQALHDPQLCSQTCWATLHLLLADITTVGSTSLLLLRVTSELYCLVLVLPWAPGDLLGCCVCGQPERVCPSRFTPKTFLPGTVSLTPVGWHSARWEHSLAD
jgi:hypothetical protein